jgi:hypothetical protein
MPKLRTRLTIAALSALGALLVLPAAGQAATNFGSRLLNDPTETTCEKYGGTCTMVSFIHPAPPEGDPYSGGAPVDGVITKFRARAYAVTTPGTITFRVADISLPDPNNNDSAIASAKGTGPTITVVPDEAALETPITEIGGRLPVKKGQHLAVDASESIGIIYNSNGNTYSYAFAPPLVEGAGPRGSTEGINELLVAATIEPDADNDGFGDETQDQCPTQATTQGACDVTPPGVTGLGVAGAKVSYSLSEAATVSLLLEKKFPGRRVGLKCVRQTPKNKTRKRCPRFKVISSFTGTGNVGANTVTLPTGKPKPGFYRLTLTARDAAGNETKTTTTFVVKKKKKKRK